MFMNVYLETFRASVGLGYPAQVVLLANLDSCLAQSMAILAQTSGINIPYMEQKWTKLSKTPTCRQIEPMGCKYSSRT
jgi:hypothetical protein